jgi:hypothetical protein
MKARRILVFLIASLLAQPAVADSPELDMYFGLVSQEIQGFLKKKNETSLAVAFSSPANFPSTAGDGFVQILSEKLKKVNIQVAPRAKYAYQGEFKPGQNAREKAGLQLHLSGKIVDVFGQQQMDFLNYDLYATNPLPAALGMTLDLSGALKTDKSATLTRGLTRPSLFTKDGMLRAHDRSPFGMEIVVGNQPRAIVDQNGLGYVDLKLTEEYQVRLTNQSQHEVAAKVQVDGIGIFHFSELRATDEARKGQPLYRYYVVGPGQSMTVPGWFINAKKSLAFKITPLAESAAAKVGQTAKIGMVTASFFASWEEGKARPPMDEPEFNASPHTFLKEQMQAGPDGKLARIKSPVFLSATGFGSNISTNAQGVRRHVGVERATLTLRYDKKKE